MCFLEGINFNDDLIEYKCLFFNKGYQKSFDKNVSWNYFFNTYKPSNLDINNFILLLKKGISPYEYMDDWEKFDETSLPELLEQVSENIWTRPFLLSYRTTISMASSFKKNQGKIRLFKWYPYVFNSTKRYQMRNMSCYFSIWNS